MIFSYDPTSEALPFLERLSVNVDRKELSTHQWCIDINSKEYPNARFFTIPVTPERLRELADFVSGIKYGYDLFIDHINAFRLTKPFLPLLFHEKMRHGYPLTLSGHYQESEVQAFCEQIGARFLSKDRSIDSSIHFEEENPPDGGTAS